MNTSPDQFDRFKKQGYHIVGAHSAVKPCLWSGRAVKDEGSCYKSTFYGIDSHRCIQMTPYLGCNQACIYCWRPIEHQVDAPRHWDAPEVIVEGCINTQRRFMSGYGGLETIDKSLWQQSLEPRHAAISLAGEPTLYPHLDGLINEFHKRSLSTFVVTNGTRPEVIENIRPTQLYMSLDAPDKDTYRDICNPRNPGHWEQILRSLAILHDHPSRTAIRITLVKGLNIKDIQGYARLIEMAAPDFIEVKAYMHLGYSRMRLERDAMPRHEEILQFAALLAGELDYQLTDEVEPSRVVLLSKYGAVSQIDWGDLN
ncbi:MAG: 4-demethylwyosine synthase TYW1 [ANME-2 cluster archaeon]|nr:4-demethylwyosine synthase TYW1 [ANME-2 cluster archaeon]